MKEDRKIFYGKYSLQSIAGGKAMHDVEYILTRIEFGDYDLHGHDVVVEISHEPKGREVDDDGQF